MRNLFARLVTLRVSVSAEINQRILNVGRRERAPSARLWPVRSVIRLCYDDAFVRIADFIEKTCPNGREIIALTHVVYFGFLLRCENQARLWLASIVIKKMISDLHFAGGVTLDHDRVKVTCDYGETACCAPPLLALTYVVMSLSRWGDR